MIDYIYRHIFLDFMTIVRYNHLYKYTNIRGIMTIYRHIYDTLICAFPPVPPEAGGLLGSSDGCICAFVYDPGTPDMTRGCYTPNIPFLNGVISQWQEQGITFSGIVHSHPPGQSGLSEADLSYICTIMEHMPPQIQALYFPVVIPGEGVFSYQARQGRTVTSDTIIIQKEI